MNNSKPKQQPEKEIGKILDKLLKGLPEEKSLREIPFIPEKMINFDTLYEYMGIIEENRENIEDAGIYFFNAIAKSKAKVDIEEQYFAICGGDYLRDNLKFFTTRELLIECFESFEIKYAFDAEIEENLSNRQKTKIIETVGYDTYKKMIVNHKKIAALLYHKEYKSYLFETFVLKRFYKNDFFKYKNIFINKSDGWEFSGTEFILNAKNSRIKKQFNSDSCVGSTINKTEIEDVLFKEYIVDKLLAIS